MGFLKKLFGGGKEPPKSATRVGTRTGSPPPPDDMAQWDTPDPQKEPSPDLPSGPRHFYLEYVGGASAKYYAVSLEEEEAGDRWRVRFTFGRIGSKRAWDTRVESATWAKASATYLGLIDEKMGKGYEVRPWPSHLRLPDGATLDAGEEGAQDDPDQVLFRAPRRGVLPPESGGSIAGISLPPGVLYAPEPEGGSRGEAPVIWVSASPVTNVGRTWSELAAAFPESGVWPLVIDARYGFKGFDDYLMDMPRGRHTEVAAILRKGWNDTMDDEEARDDHVAPFGRQFPGLADRTAGTRPTSIDHIVSPLKGHLGLVAVNRPADVLDAIGWMGAANYDADPLDMSTVLRSWEVRFDAYLVGLTTDTITLAVGRPARDRRGATAIAAEHYAFCSDNIDQGVGSIRAYAHGLVDAHRWDFWWD